jgi:hypothetical protein
MGCSARRKKRKKIKEKIAPFECLKERLLEKTWATSFQRYNECAEVDLYVLLSFYIINIVMLIIIIIIIGIH